MEGSVTKTCESRLAIRRQIKKGYKVLIECPLWDLCENLKTNSMQSKISVCGWSWSVDYGPTD